MTAIQEIIQFNVNNFGHDVQVMVSPDEEWGGKPTGALRVSFRLVEPSIEGIDALVAERDKYFEDNNDWVGTVEVLSGPYKTSEFLKKTKGRGVISARHWPLNHQNNTAYRGLSVSRAFE